MKRLSMLVLFLILITQTYSQRSISEVNQLIVDGAYEEAIAALEEKFVEPCCSKELYENLGFAYYHAGNLAKSILFYEKALHLAPRDKKLKEAITHVRSELPVQITVIPDFILLRLWRSLASYLTANSWIILQTFLSISLLAVLYLWMFRMRTKGWGNRRWITISSLALMILLTGLLGYYRYGMELGGDIGISNDVHRIYNAPDERSGEVVTIGPGNKVFIIDTIGDWYKVQLEDKDEGWIRKENIYIV